MVITSFVTRQNKQISNGYDWDLQLQSVKIAKPQSIKQQVKNPDTKQADKKTETKVKEKTNAGRKQMQSTRNSGTNYTNQKTASGRVNTQKTNGSANKNVSVSKNNKAVKNTQPVNIRNKMYGSLTNGTQKRASTIMQKNNSKVSKKGGSGGFGASKVKSSTRKGGGSR